MTIRSNLYGYVGQSGSMVVLLGIAIATVAGCSGTSNSDPAADLAQVERATSSVGDAAEATEANLPTVPATDVVSQFLDLVRRGGGDSGASSLLTAKAQSELNRIGRKVQPIGSPDARFVVTRAESVPENPDASLVHSIWNEPNGETAANLEYQVVWALQKEANQWRISGLAMEIDPNQNPLIVNFEDGNRMAALLAETESADQSENSAARSTANSNPAASNAAVDDPSLKR